MFARLPLTDSRWHSHLGSHGKSYSECITVHAVTLTNACVQQDFVSSVQVRRTREHRSLAPSGTRGAAGVLLLCVCLSCLAPRRHFSCSNWCCVGSCECTGLSEGTKRLRSLICCLAKASHPGLRSCPAWKSAVHLSCFPSESCHHVGWPGSLYLIYSALWESLAELRRPPWGPSARRSPVSPATCFCPMQEVANSTGKVTQSAPELSVPGFVTVALE